MSNASVDKLRRVATKQRRVIFALLAYIIAYIVAIGTAQLDPLITVGALLIGLGVIVFALVSIVSLAIEITNTAVAVLCAFLMFVPCVSLVVLLIINQKATKYLQQHGIEVGFFGADPSRL